MACGPEKFRYHDDLMLDETGKGKGALRKLSLFLAEVTNSELYNLVNSTGTYLLIAIHFCNNRDIDV